MEEFRRSWRIVLAAFIGVIFGVNGFSYASVGVLANPLALAFGQSVATISIWVSFLFLGNTLVSPLVGSLADRIGARRVVLSCLPLFILTWAVAGVIGTRLWMLYLVALAAGCFGTGAGPLAYGRVVNTWFDAGRGTALGMMSAGIGLSYLFGPRLLQSVADTYGWRIGFFFLAATHLIPLPLMIMWLHERREIPAGVTAPAETGHSTRMAVRMPVFWYAAAAFLFYGVCAGGVTFNLVPFLTAAGLSRASAATYMGLLGAFSIIGRVFTGLVIDRLHVAFICAVILVMEASAFVVFGSLGAAHVVAAMSVTGFALGGEVACLNYTVARYFGVKHYGAINGLLSVAVGCGVAMGPPLFNLLREFSGVYRLPFLTFAGFATVAGAFFVVLGFCPFFQEPASGDA